MLQVSRPNRPKVGLLLNQEEEPGTSTPRWSDMLAVATDSESIGVDSLWPVDHFLWPVDPWRREMVLGGEGTISGRSTFGVWESWTTLAALAAVTTRVQLGTLVTCTGFRNPALLAKMADSVDEISGGRLTLGLGSGDTPDEHRMFGYSSDRLISRFEEALAIILPLLRGETVDFEGEFYAARECELQPRGPRQEGPPILIGSLATGPRMLRLVAQHADIWNAWITDRSHPTAVPPLMEAVDASCAKHGRDPTTLRRTAAVAVALSGPMTERPGIITGSVEEIATTLRAFGAVGIDEVQVRLFPTNQGSIEFFGGVVGSLDH